MRRLMSRGTSYARPKHISLPQATSYCVSSSALAQYKITIIFEFELNLDRVSLFLCFMRSDLMVLFLPVVKFEIIKYEAIVVPSDGVFSLFNLLKLSTFRKHKSNGKVSDQSFNDHRICKLFHMSRVLDI